METTTACDGMTAYLLKDWTREKLHYIARYMDILCTAMRGKWNLVYADMLAGPGLCVDTVTGEEALGSPLLALKRPEFSRILLNDRDPRIISVLESRIPPEQMHRIHISTADCNVVANKARDYLFPDSGTDKTLGLAVVDPQAYQMQFESIRDLTKGVRLDLIIVFMSSFARRFINQPTMTAPLAGMIGAKEVENIKRLKSKGQRPTFEDLLLPIEKRLNSIGYDYVYAPTRTENTNRQTVYHIVFASKHPRGQEFFHKISQQRWTGQRRLAI